MIARFLLAALVAGIVAGIAMTGAQMVKVVPLIVHAEQFEQAQAHRDAVAPGHDQAASENDRSPRDAGRAKEGERPFGPGRFGGTLLANLVAGAGFALVLAAIVLVSGQTIHFANAFAWGMLAWLAVQFLPAMGLAPELPGMPAADLAARQYWWVFAVGASAAGLWVAAFTKPVALRIGGLFLIGLPHIAGAPQPETIASSVPAHLASEFAVAALATTLFFWLVLAYALAWCMARFGVRE